MWPHIVNRPHEMSTFGSERREPKQPFPHLHLQTNSRRAEKIIRPVEMHDICAKASPIPTELYYFDIMMYQVASEHSRIRIEIKIHAVGPHSHNELGLLHSVFATYLFRTNRHRRDCRRLQAH